jgi:hypothetical protein
VINEIENINSKVEEAQSTKDLGHEMGIKLLERKKKKGNIGA